MEQEIILENENEEQPITLENENITIIDVPTDNIYTKDEVDFLLDEKADLDSVYTKTDTDELLSVKANSSDIPTNVSDLNNDAGYISTETDPLFSNSVAYGITNEDITNWNNKSTFSGSYNDLSDKPTIPVFVFNGDFDFDINKDVGIYICRDGNSVVNIKNGSQTLFNAVKLLNNQLIIFKNPSSANNGDIIASFTIQGIELINGNYRINNLSLARIQKTSSGLTGITDSSFPFGYASLTTASTISGIYTFISLPETSVLPTTNNQLTNKNYVDSAITTAISNIVDGDEVAY